MRRRRKKIFFFILTLFFIFFLLALFYFLKFKEITIEPEEFSLYFLNYFQNKSFFEVVLNLKKIMLDFKEIIKIEIQPNFLTQKLKIKIEMAKIVAQICDFQRCYFLDNYSRIISPKILTTNNFLKIQSELKLEENSLLNPKITNFLSLLFEYSNWKPLILKEIKIYSNFDLGVFDDKNREFLFDLNRDFEEQIKKLHLFLSKDFQGSRIDLRIPKKIYYR